MKQALLKTIVATVGLFVCVNAFADSSASVQSIPEGLQARAEMLQKPKIAAGIGVDTYIMVINYTNDTVFATFPTQKIQLTRQTSGRYQQSNYTGRSMVRLQNANGAEFWADQVGYQDILSIYVSNGKYVVYDTH
jgi:sulfite reductase beta subunit-like hemoprotein